MRQFFLLCLSACVPLLAAEGPQYSLRDLGTFGNPYAGARAINGRGQIVVAVNHNPGAWFWTYIQDGATTVQLGFGPHGFAKNNRGQVVGEAGYGSLTQAFL